MAKLRDLVNVGINQNSIKIQGVDIPVIFTMQSFPYLQEAYGKPYHLWEKDFNVMMKKGRVNVGKKEIKMMSSLIYSMVRTGGTECTPYELENSIPLHEMPGVFEVILPIFNAQMFQVEDTKKLKQEKKS